MELASLIRQGRAGERLWLYATYHCNLACTYCLTESHPRIANRRELDPDTMLDAARSAAGLGFRSLGITGGEVFMIRSFPETLGRLSEHLPAVVLTNGMLFTPSLLDRLSPLSPGRVAFQLSLDAAGAAANDIMRGPGNHRAVVAAIGRLRDRGFEVRIATTLADDAGADDLEELCVLHRSLGIPDEHHVVRRIVRRGKAQVEGLGAPLGPDDVLPELTLTADGAFLHPFAPTVRRGVTDLDLRVAPAPLPLEDALAGFVASVGARPHGDDVARNVR